MLTGPGVAAGTAEAFSSTKIGAFALITDGIISPRCVAVIK